VMMAPAAVMMMMPKTGAEQATHDEDAISAEDDGARTGPAATANDEDEDGLPVAYTAARSIWAQQGSGRNPEHEPGGSAAGSSARERAPSRSSPSGGRSRERGRVEAGGSAGGGSSARERAPSRSPR